jgi:cell division protein FtsB
MVDIVDLVFLALLGLFGGLLLYTLVTAMVRANGLKLDLDNLRDQHDQQEERINEIRKEVRDDELEVTVLEQERQALDAQDACLRRLEVAYKRSQTEAEE